MRIPDARVSHVHRLAVSLSVRLSVYPSVCLSQTTSTVLHTGQCSGLVQHPTPTQQPAVRDESHVLVHVYEDSWSRPVCPSPTRSLARSTQLSCLASHPARPSSKPPYWPFRRPITSTSSRSWIATTSLAVSIDWFPMAACDCLRPSPQAKLSTSRRIARAHSVATADMVVACARGVIAQRRQR